MTNSIHIAIKTFVIISIAIVCMLQCAKEVHANDFSLGLYPPIIQIQADVPTSITKDITLVNASENTQSVDVSFRLFTNSPYSDGQVSYIANSEVPSPDKDIFQKIQLLDGDNPVNTIIIGPKQKKTYTLHVGLPKDEPPADYYFSIIFLGSNQTNQANSSSTISAGIATNVLLSIGPKDATLGSLDEFSSPWFIQTGPVPFTVSINNFSKHFITPTGQILIRNMFGQLVGKVDLLPVNILGESSRYIPSKENVSDSNGHPAAQWTEKVLFGPYRANIIVSLSDQGPLFTRTIYFLAMPWQYLVVGGIALVLIIVIIEKARKRARTI